MSAKNTQTLADMSVDELLAAVRQTAIEAVATMVTPVTEVEPQPEARANGKPLDLSDPAKVKKTKAAKEVAKYFGADGPDAPATWGSRKRIAAFGDLDTTAARTIVFESPLTRAQASLASHHLENGRSIRFGDVTISPK